MSNSTIQFSKVLNKCGLNSFFLQRRGRLEGVADGQDSQSTTSVEPVGSYVCVRGKHRGGHIRCL